MEWIVIVVLVALGLWVAFSKDRLAVALRVRFTGAKKQMADAVDDAVSRIDTAISQTDTNLVRAKEGLLAVKAQRNGLEAKIATAQANVTKWTNAAERAAAAGNERLTTETITRRNAALALLTELQPQLVSIQASEQKIIGNVQVLEARRAELRTKREEVKRRATTAGVVLSTNELLAGIDLDSGAAHLEAAEEIVSTLEARAAAMEEMAEVERADERLEEELAALTQPDVKAEVEVLMARHRPIETA